MTGRDCTILLDILPGRDDLLLARLQEIQSDLLNNPYLPFSRMPQVHFARLTRLGDRLLVNAIHDGATEQFIEAVRTRLPEFASVLENCRDFPGMDSRDAFHAWFCPQPLPADIFFRAHSYSVADVRAFLSLRARIDEWLARPEAEPLLADLSHIPQLLQPVRHPGVLARAATSLSEAGLDLVISALRWPQQLAAGRTPPGLGREPSLTVHTPCWLTDRTDLVQNEMTVIMAVHPRLRGYLRTILRAAAGALRNPPADGTLAGVATVHFGRWMMVDGGRHLLFVSNYDGSWETYISEVASERVGRGLDLIWGCCLGYPAAGARDIQTFKDVIISHQHRAQVFYSAYPDQSARNIISAIRVAESLGAWMAADPLRTFFDQF